MASEQPAVRRLSILDEESVPVVDGTLDWIPVRRRLGVRAFGTNAYRAARAGDLVIEEHVESPGQEELYLVLKGRARIVVGEEEFECSVGEIVFITDPELKRHGVALEDDTAVLAVGGWPDRPYHPLPWEPIFLAQQHMQSGDWAAAAETLEREAGEHRGTAIVQYRLACCYARLGDSERAFTELRAAIKAEPAMARRAADEEHLASLRSEPEWRAVVG